MTIVNMATTIQVEKAVKEKLLQLKLTLSKNRGRTVNYNEVIEELISLYHKEFQEADKYLKVRELANSLDFGLYKEYRREKLRDISEEENNHPII